MLLRVTTAVLAAVLFVGVQAAADWTADSAFDTGSKTTYQDKDWNVMFYANCDLPRYSSIQWVTEGSERFLRFTLKDGHIGGCRNDNRHRSRAPYWERAEIKQAHTLEQDRDYSLTFRVRFLKGYDNEREGFLQIHQYVSGCRVGPRVMLKFDDGKLLDTWGTVVSTGRRRMAGTAANRQRNGSYAYTLPITTAPGRYALRVAAIDGAGRDGSVEHPLRAGVALSDAPVALGVPEIRDAERPAEAGSSDGDAEVSSGRLAVSADVHAESAWVFNRLRVAVEVARDPDGPALVQAEAPLRGREDAPLRSASAHLSVRGLPPGPYRVRVRVLRGADEVSRIHRALRIVD